MNAHNILIHHITELEKQAEHHGILLADYTKKIKKGGSAPLLGYLFREASIAGERRDAALNQIIGMRVAADIINRHQ